MTRITFVVLATGTILTACGGDEAGGKGAGAASGAGTSHGGAGVGGALPGARQVGDPAGDHGASQPHADCL